MYQIPIDIGDINLPPKRFGSGCKIHLGAPNQVIPNGVVTKVRFDTEDWDFLSEFDNGVGNYFFTPWQAGLYLIHVKVHWTGIAPASNISVQVHLNGVMQIYTESWIPANVGMSDSIFIIMNITPNDWLEVYVLQNTGAAKSLLNGITNTVLTMQQIG